MHRNIFPKRFLQEFPHNSRLVMRNTKIEALVECQRMAAGASIGEPHGRHQLPLTQRFRRMQCSRRDQSHFVALFVADFCRAVAGIRVSQIRSSGGSAMAIPALKLHIRPVGTATNRLHVNCVIQLDTSQIAAVAGAIPSECSEFRMAVLETIDSRCVERIGKTLPQILVAPGTNFIGRSPDVDPPAMFWVAGCAIGGRDLGGMMNGTVVTAEASAFPTFPGKVSPLFDTPSTAFPPPTPIIS